jgi:diadenosine tetraphosphate (Ap4A) HIT family hydrolase
MLDGSPFAPIPGFRRPDLFAEGCDDFVTDDSVAFLDKYPVSPGHLLVVPRRVVASVYDLPACEYNDLWRLVRRCRTAFNEGRLGLVPDGYNIGLNDGTAAGQTIDHAHIHIIPRYRGDVEDARGGIRWVKPGKANYWG